MIRGCSHLEFEKMPIIEKEDKDGWIVVRCTDFKRKIKSKKVMTRYWVSWWSGNYEDEGCTKPPFQYWLSGQRDRPMYGMSKEIFEAMLSAKLNDSATDDYIDRHGRDDCCFCAVLDAENEDDIWAAVFKYFPDFKQRFIEERDSNWAPGDRFLGFENNTSLTGV